ncbi:MAG: phosphate/phosphite/phosphonate ABC transporter substrate-binding protein [Anaerolineae bacterium]|nr:phosphate/phosphite/phosphonate ABC transporter substrate-binding protein [Phycisphaerae bacterium]
MTTEMSSPVSPQPSRRSPSFIPIILLTVIAVAAGAAAMYFIKIYKPEKDSIEQTRARLMHMTGMDRPVKNKLAATFADEDADLVADPPKDASQLVDPPKLVFCFVASEEPSEYATQWKPFCDHLSKMTGKPVEYVEFKNSEEQLRALRDGKLQVTGLNSGSVPLAVNVCGFVPVARVPTAEPAGTHVEIIVPADSPLQSVDEFRDLKYTLALVEPNSNSGYKAPMVLLHSDKDRDPERDYKIRSTGDHRVSIDGIAKHQYDAAAVSADLLAREEAQGKIKKSDYRSIFKSESFPSAALGYAHNLKPELAAKVREAINTFDMKGTPLEIEFAPATQTTFIPVNYKDNWSLIRRIDDACGTVHELK